MNSAAQHSTGDGENPQQNNHRPAALERRRANKKDP
jgi:hypothetical protein